MEEQTQKFADLEKQYLQALETIDELERENEELSVKLLKERNSTRPRPLVPRRNLAGAIERHSIDWRSKRIVVGCSVEIATEDEPEPVCVAEIPEHMANVRLLTQADQDFQAVTEGGLRDYVVTVVLKGPDGAIWNGEPRPMIAYGDQSIAAEDMPKFFLRKGTRAEVWITANPKLTGKGKIQYRGTFIGTVVPKDQFAGVPPPNCELPPEGIPL